ncbi:MAG: DUF4395 family protein [Desulfobacterales bacterium]
MSDSAKLNFVEQQGFRNSSSSSCEVQYTALMFQPRLLGAFVLAGLIFQSWLLFLTLSAILWWNVFIPSLNPFDAVYNRFIAGPKGIQGLTPAPGPRRFAQGMAATFMLCIGIFLLLKWQVLTWIFESLLVIALSALIFGKFCLGSYIFHLIKGEAGFANRTLPWAKNN